MESKFLNGEGVRHLNHRLQVRNALDRINIIDVNSTSSVSQPDVNCIYRISNAVPRIGSVDKICINLGASSDEFFQVVLGIPDSQWLSNKQLSDFLSLDDSLNPKFYIVCQTESTSGLGLVKLTAGEGALYGLVDTDLTTYWSAIKYTDGSYESQWGSESFVRIDDQGISYNPDLDLPTGSYNSLLSKFISIDMDFNTSAAYAVTNGYEWQIFNEGIDQLETRTNTLETKTNTLGTKINTLETKVNTLQVSSGVLNLRELRLEEQIGEPKTISDDMVNSIMKATQVCVGESNYSVILTISGTRGGGNNVYFTGWNWPANGYSPTPAYLLLNADNKTVVFSGI